MMKQRRIFLEMLLLFSAFFLPGYIFPARGLPQGAVSSMLMIQAVITGVPQTLLILYIVGIQADFLPGRWGLSPLAPGDWLRIALLAVGSILLVTLLTALYRFMPAGWAEAYSKGYRWSLQSPAQIPLVLVFGLSTGYREELFFRVYLLRRLEDLGSPLAFSMAASIAIFSLSHMYEGPLGLVATAVLGALYCVMYVRRPNLHVIAISHGLYDAVVLSLTLLAG